MSSNIASEFVGTWRLVSYSAVTSGGETIYPLGRNARGRIIYDSSGRMSVQLADPDRAAFAARDPRAATDAECGPPSTATWPILAPTPSTPTGVSLCTIWRWL